MDALHFGISSDEFRRRRDVFRLQRNKVVIPDGCFPEIAGLVKAGPGRMPAGFVDSSGWFLLIFFFLNFEEEFIMDPLNSHDFF